MTSLVVGNWKMHTTQAQARTLARQILRGLRKGHAGAEVVLAPPYTSLRPVRDVIRRSQIRLAGQNAHWHESGAFTGEISSSMLCDVGCEYVILGHSERRHIFGESDRSVAQKIAACLGQGLRPILCVGETLDEREQGITTRVICRQLKVALKGVSKNVIGNVEIAYEPVWAIGTGRNATPEQVGRVHQRIRKTLVALFGKARGNRVRILYGGSVKPENAGALASVSEVNGLLVGGASLKAETFLPIVRCFSIR